MNWKDELSESLIEANWRDWDSRSSSLRELGLEMSSRITFMKIPRGAKTCTRLLTRLKVCLLGMLLAISVRGEAAKVVLLRVPNGGIQPQSTVDAKGVVYLIY